MTADDDTQKFYQPLQVRGHPAWYTPDEADIETRIAMGVVFEAEMLEAGTFPSNEQLATMDNETRMKTKGNAMARIVELVEDQFFAPVGLWLRENPSYETHDVVSESSGSRVLIDFQTTDGQMAFLASFPKWTSTRPAVWWDKGIPVAIGEGRWGRNEDYDL